MFYLTDKEIVEKTDGFLSSAEANAETAMSWLQAYRKRVFAEEYDEVMGHLETAFEHLRQAGFITKNLAEWLCVEVS